MKQMLNLACLALFATVGVAAAKGEWNSAGIAGLGVVLITLVLLVRGGLEQVMRKHRKEKR